MARVNTATATRWFGHYLGSRGGAYTQLAPIYFSRQRWLAIQVPGSAKNAAAVRFFGTELLPIQIDLDV
jgi:hypothetical protein